MIFRLFPNPNAGVFDIKINFDKMETGNITLFDTLGRTIWSQEFTAEKIDEHLFLGEIISAPSTYFMVVKTKEEEFVREVVIY